MTAPTPLTVTALPRYARLGASSRLRWFQFEPPLVAAGLRLRTHALLDDAYLEHKYRGQSVLRETLRGYLRRARLLAGGLDGGGVVWLEKELWPWAPAWLERWLLRGRPFVLDFDDAIFHNYDRHHNPLLRALFGRKIDRLMAGAATWWSSAAPTWPSARARAGARWVEWLPTVVDPPAIHGRRARTRIARSHRLDRLAGHRPLCAAPGRSRWPRCRASAPSCCT